MSLLSRIIAEIRENGAMAVSRYMELALADPEAGYYTTRDPLGLTGDFVTSPEISQIFGEMCGIWLAEAWHSQGLGAAELVEPGPGRGTLMADMLRATKRVGGFHEALDVTLVEISPVLRTVQEKTLADAHPNIRWAAEIPQAERPLLLAANEFFDALPIHQYTASEAGWHERLITVDDAGKLSFTQAEQTAQDISAELLVSETILEKSPASVEVVTTVASRIARHGGAALIIDYGYFSLEGVLQASGDTLQAVRKHKFHDVLDAPGTADITAHVDFTALAKAAEAAGAQASPIISQREFLRRMGGQQRLEQLVRNAPSDAARERLIAGYDRLTNPNGMGELFLALAITPQGVEAPIF